MAALRGGLFNGLRIIDSTGKEFIVRNAQKLHGIGPLGGFNIFLNRRIKVELSFDDTVKTVQVDEVRQIVLRDFHNWRGWESRGDFREIKAAVGKAETVGEIIRSIA